MAYNRIWLFGFCALILAGVAFSSTDPEDHSMPQGRWLPGSSVPGEYRIPLDVFKKIGRLSQNVMALRSTCRTLRSIDYGVEYVLTLPRSFNHMALLDGLPLSNITALNLYNFTRRQIEGYGLSFTVSPSKELYWLLDSESDSKCLIQRFDRLKTLYLPAFHSAYDESGYEFGARLYQFGNRSLEVRLYTNWLQRIYFICSCTLNELYIRHSQIPLLLQLSLGTENNHLFCPRNHHWMKKSGWQLNSESFASVLGLYEQPFFRKLFSDDLTYAHAARFRIIDALVYMSDKPKVLCFVKFLLMGNILDEYFFFFLYDPHGNSIRAIESLRTISSEDGLQILTLLQNFVPGYEPDHLDERGKPYERWRLQPLIVYEILDHRHDREPFGLDRADFLCGLIRIVADLTENDQLLLVQKFIAFASFSELMYQVRQEKVRQSLLSSLNEDVQNHARKIIQRGFSAVLQETALLDREQFAILINYLIEQNIHINIFERDAEKRLRTARLQCFGLQEEERERGCCLQ